MIILASSGFKWFSLFISIIVVVLLAAALITLFYFLSLYFKKCVKAGMEDEMVKKEILQEYKDFVQESSSSKPKDIQIEKKPNHVDTTLSQVQDIMRIRKKKIKKVFSILFIVLYVILGTNLLFGIITRATDGIANLFGKGWLVIETGSMETVNPVNTYVYEHELDDQIKQYSLITLDEVENESDMELYKVYAFYDDSGRIIVHRLIEKNRDMFGNTLYTFKGDANSGSASYEVNIDFDKILAVYDGKDNFFFGMMILYTQSNLGLISIVLGTSIVVFFDIFERKIDVEIEKRKQLILKDIF